MGKSFSLTYVFYLCFCAKGLDVNGNGLIYKNRKWKDSPCVPGRSCGLLATAFFFNLQKKEKVLAAILSD